ncbi:uncharacterized protein FOMMEDRAFT_109363 [Fomitiporia mediterranea MF3/22]|uniref:uncharacterized protein n=1 Tax=Fomitiporia mediterranea (strain MF3/22) TaxID=694068 RepID=UPI0004407703|nr:uncharacterized protein FOMMEDRAFT_109363 [Fomitiporia mediterranea MF3/22]EJD02165.1 hypothetical protein FOMMEDRAFT_109363 [Fomitiporia mediterranea MF3/22]
MFASPPPSDGQDGQSEEHPIHLEGVKAHDFRCFLKAFLPRPEWQGRLIMTDTELESALHLAKMRCFDRFQSQLIEKLNNHNLRSSRKLQLARIFDIQEWFGPELRLLALRSSNLTTEEWEELGPKLTVVVSQLRDERYNALLGSIKDWDPEDAEEHIHEAEDKVNEMLNELLY